MVLRAVTGLEYLQICNLFGLMEHLRAIFDTLVTFTRTVISPAQLITSTYFLTFTLLLTSTKFLLKQFAAIFDMDGTLVDNTPYHYRSWQTLFKKYNLGDLPIATYYAEMSGVPIWDTTKRLFGDTKSVEEMRALAHERETIYEGIFTSVAAPLNGLIPFLKELKAAGIRTAIASSSSIEGIDFVLSHIDIREYFDVIVDGAQVIKGKPNPDIFLLAAEKLQASPEQCLVFEDSAAGIKAGNAAGMKVIGVATGQAAEKLKPSVKVINNYTEISLADLKRIFH